MKTRPDFKHGNEPAANDYQRVCIVQRLIKKYREIKKEKKGRSPRARQARVKRNEDRRLGVA